MSKTATSYFIMNGKAKEAARFYEQALGADIMSLQTFGEMPGADNMSDELKQRVANGVMKIGDTDVQFSDGMDTPEQPLTHSKVDMSIKTDDVVQSERIFESLKQDGKVVMPMGETPFSPAFGIVTDKFGITFHIVTEQKR